MTPAEIRSATRDGILDAFRWIVYALAGGVGVALCVTHPREALTSLGPLAAAVGVVWALFAMADSMHPALRFLGGMAWKGVGYAITLGSIYLIARGVDPPFARLLAELPAQLWRSTTW
jgi:predicted exporter